MFNNLASDSKLKFVQYTFMYTLDDVPVIENACRAIVPMFFFCETLPNVLPHNLMKIFH